MTLASDYTRAVDRAEAQAAAEADCADLVICDACDHPYYYETRSDCPGCGCRRRHSV